jgi:hypothetical protein
MRTGELYSLDHGPRVPDPLTQPEGSGSPRPNRERKLAG